MRIAESVIWALAQASVEHEETIWAPTSSLVSDWLYGQIPLPFDVSAPRGPARTFWLRYKSATVAQRAIMDGSASQSDEQQDDSWWDVFRTVFVMEIRTVFDEVRVNLSFQFYPVYEPLLGQHLWVCVHVPRLPGARGISPFWLSCESSFDVF